MSSGAEFDDRIQLLRSNSPASGGDLERGGSQSPHRKNHKGSALSKRLDRGFSGSSRNVKLRSDHRVSSSSSSPCSPSTSNHCVGANAAATDYFLGDSVPPEWALLLIGCLLGVSTGLCVAAFNRAVSSLDQVF